MNHEALQTARRKYGRDFIGNVVRIIDSRTIIVNIGKGDLTVGDTIQIYEPGEILKDVDGSELCAYNYVKDELDVIQVEQQYSVCRKMKSITKTFNFALSPLLEQTETKYIPLNIDKDDIQPLTPNNSKVRIGDPIKLA